jgi:hypothetical protein
MYNPETNKLILSQDVGWADWKCTYLYAKLSIFEQVEETENKELVGIDYTESVKSANWNTLYVILNDLDDNKMADQSRTRSYLVLIQNAVSGTRPGPPVPSPLHIQHQDDKNIIKQKKN